MRPGFLRWGRRRSLPGERAKSESVYPARSRRRLGLAVEFVVTLVVAVLVGQTWLLQGFPVVFEVVSGSMAPTLMGPHDELACQECGYVIVRGTDRIGSVDQMICPNCGHRQPSVDVSAALPGDGLLVDRSAFLLRRPRRWEPVVFRDPGRASRLVVKRVVGLPGESVQIRHGDVLIDGVVQRKTLAQQQAVAILVHDADFTGDDSPQGLAARWRPDRADLRWTSSTGVFTHPEASTADAVEWLVYHHTRTPADPAEPMVESPVTDTCGYNQPGRPRGELFYPVADLMLSFELVRLSGPGSLTVCISDGQEHFAVLLHRDDDSLGYEARRGEVILPDGSGYVPFARDRTPVTVSLFDQQLLVAFSGTTRVAFPYQRTTSPHPTSEPLAIGVQATAAEIRHLRIDRDIYYTRPDGIVSSPGVDEPLRLDEGSYYVLGDNSSISQDSRTWGKPKGVTDRLLVGKPCFVHFPARRLDWGPWRIHVPDLARMRWVR